MSQDAKPLSTDDMEHFRTIRVCGCEDSSPDACHFKIRRRVCPNPVLDGIGAAWINDHFDSILATIDRLNAQLATARKALEDAALAAASVQSELTFLTREVVNHIENARRAAAIDKSADGAETEREE